MKKRNIIILILTLISIFTANHIYNRVKSNTLTKGAKKTMAEYIKLPDFLEPVIVPVRYEDVEYNPIRVFSVPFKNSVGTFDLDKSATVIEFKGKDIEKKVIMHLPDDFPIGGEDYFGYQPISNHEVYYWGLNLMDVFSFNKKLDVGFGIETYGEDYQNVFPLDPFKYRFLCKMDDGITRLKIIELHQPIYPGDEHGYGNYTTVAKIDFERDQIITGGTDSWINRNTIFIHCVDKSKLFAYDYNLKEVEHPLAAYITEKKVDVSAFAIHPTLPFAVFNTSIEDTVSGAYTTLNFIFRWEHQEKDKRLIPFPLQNIIYPEQESIHHSLDDFQFSPDGKWFLFKDYYNPSDTISDVDNPALFAYPVEENNPFFIGKPIRLGKAFREETKKVSSCWIADPCSYVVCDGMLLYKWELPVRK